MAVAKQTKRVEIKLVEQEIPHEEVVLTLSKEEAQFILDYLGHTVTGSSYGPRKLSDSVVSALIAAGLKITSTFPGSIEGDMNINHFKGVQGGY